MSSARLVFPVPIWRGRKPKASSRWEKRPTKADPNHFHEGWDIVYVREPGEPDKPPDGAVSARNPTGYYMPRGIFAVSYADGVVADVGRLSKGTWVKIDHETIRFGRLRTVYRHLVGTPLSVGDSVSAGQVVGEIGDDPSVADIRHLHFETVRSGHTVDPAPYMSDLEYIEQRDIGASALIALGAGALLLLS